VADKILNTGLDALLGDVATPNKQTIKEIELDKIKPNRFQPRQSFDEQKINELSQSISKAWDFVTDTGKRNRRWWI
jgi:ParB family chromosome partitioning protein